jgi:pseudaminic acid biosynthesis-associated methylase
VEWRSRLEGWRSIVDGLRVKRVLEVGCNRGHNLVALSEILKPTVEFAGVEPNSLALQIARRSTDRAGFLAGTVYDLPFKNECFDLVFTCGVLIHIPNEKLKKALNELERVASRYLLLIEYFSEQDEEISYRGRTGLLWKRNFPRHMMHACEELTTVRQGYLGRDEGFDRTHWWLMEKNAGLAR